MFLIREKREKTSVSIKLTFQFRGIPLILTILKSFGSSQFGLMFFGCEENET